MPPLKLVETEQGALSLLLNAGETSADALVEELGHEPNGYFWEGVAKYLVSTEAPGLEGRVSYGFRGGNVLRLRPRPRRPRAARRADGRLANDGPRLQSLIATAEASGFDFDD